MKIKNTYIIAGPNGAGKTTFAKEFLPEYVNCPHFVNADLIAQGLSPFSPRQAAIKSGKLVLEQIHGLAHRGVDFGFETTLSGKTYIKHFSALKDKGYRLHLFFLWIPNTQLAVARIKERVSEGGHHVPLNDVRRRFKRSSHNFFTLYKPIIDSWMIFDNAGIKPLLIAKAKNGDIAVINNELFLKVTKQAGIKL